MSTPPSSRPTTAPLLATAPKTPNALPRSRGSVNVEAIRASAAGAMNAALAPWSARPATSTSNVGAAPASADARPKPVSPMVSARRRPIRSEVLPPSSSSPAKESVYAVTTYERCASSKPSTRWAVGSATFTMVASSATMSCASAITPSAAQRWSDRRVVSVAAGPVVVAMMVDPS